ncbi:AraC-like DNA-binding protein [Paraburkholderia sp. BL27I4N3]|nr:AraC-like DNA-binding protein [Paraburkholderia sp. BL27I4N3]
MTTPIPYIFDIAFHDCFWHGLIASPLKRLGLVAYCLHLSPIQTAMVTSVRDISSSYKVSRASHPNEHAAAYRDWIDHRLYQLSPKFSFDAVLLDHQVRDEISVNKETITTPSIEQMGRVPEDKVLIALIRSTSGVIMNGRQVNGDMIYLASGRSVQCITKSSVQSDFLTLDRRFFVERLPLANLPISGSNGFELVVKPATGLTTAYHRKVGRHFDLLDGDPLFSEIDHSTESLLTCVGEMLGGGTSDNDTCPNASTRAYIVRRSSELFVANCHDQEFGVLDLCSHLKISRRTLQYSFEQVMGISPMQYMRIVRLNVARRALTESAAGAQIQGAAFDAGFGHIGRFSKYYSDFFGELPSATLQSGRA